jgi:hypothetical protein
MFYTVSICLAYYVFLAFLSKPGRRPADYIKNKMSPNKIKTTKYNRATIPQNIEQLQQTKRQKS